MNSKQYSRIVGSSEEGRKNKSLERELDFYATPPEAVYGLMKRVSFDDGTIWEPACGKNDIANVLATTYNKSIFCSDIHDWGAVPLYLMDFLNDKSLVKAAGMECRHIITNPPYRKSLDFAKQGVKYIEGSGGKLALLLRIQWLEGIKRRKFFDVHPPSWVWVFSRRLPRMHREGYEGKKTSSMIAFAWFIWDDSNKLGETRLGWI